MRLSLSLSLSLFNLSGELVICIEMIECSQHSEYSHLIRSGEYLFVTRVIHLEWNKCDSHATDCLSLSLSELPFSSVNLSAHPSVHCEWWRDENWRERKRQKERRKEHHMPWMRVEWCEKASPHHEMKRKRARCFFGLFFSREFVHSFFLPLLLQQYLQWALSYWCSHWQFQHLQVTVSHVHTPEKANGDDSIRLACSLSFPRPHPVCCCRCLVSAFVSFVSSNHANSHFTRSLTDSVGAVTLQWTDHFQQEIHVHVCTECTHLTATRISAGALMLQTSREVYSCTERQHETRKEESRRVSSSFSSSSSSSSSFLFNRLKIPLHWVCD